MGHVYAPSGVDRVQIIALGAVGAMLVLLLK